MTYETTRRAVLGGLAAAAALARPSFAQTADDKTLYELAKKDGEVTWYTSHYNAETAERIRRAFIARYPDVKVNLLRATTQVAFQRLSQEVAANAIQCDVFGTSDVGHFVQLKSRDQLERYVPRNADTMLEVFRNLDPDGFFQATSAGVITITSNTEKVPPADVPKNWMAFTDLKWKNMISVGHPGYSGYVGTWGLVMFKLYGEEFFKKLKETSPQVGRSVQDTVTMLSSGERSLAAGNIASTLESKARGNPLAISYPDDGIVLIDSPSAIIKGTKHPNASRLMMEFLSSPEVSQIMVKEYGESMHKDVPPNAAMKPLDTVKTNHLSVKEISEGLPKVAELWRNVFGM
jgi:iron(III) transport system substrate-binding protein